MPLNNSQGAVVPPFEKGGRGDLRHVKYENPPQSPFFKGGGNPVVLHPANCSEAYKIMRNYSPARLLCARRAIDFIEEVFMFKMRIPLEHSKRLVPSDAGGFNVTKAFLE